MRAIDREQISLDFLKSTIALGSLSFVTLKTRESLQGRGFSDAFRILEALNKVIGGLFMASVFGCALELAAASLAGPLVHRAVEKVETFERAEVNLDNLLNAIYLKTKLLACEAECVKALMTCKKAVLKADPLITKEEVLIVNKVAEMFNKTIEKSLVDRWASGSWNQVEVSSKSRQISPLTANLLEKYKKFKQIETDCLKSQYYLEIVKIEDPKVLEAKIEDISKRLDKVNCLKDQTQSCLTGLIENSGMVDSYILRSAVKEFEVSRDKFIQSISLARDICVLWKSVIESCKLMEKDSFKAL